MAIVVLTLAAIMLPSPACWRALLYLGVLLVSLVGAFYVTERASCTRKEMTWWEWVCEVYIWLVLICPFGGGCS